MNTETTASGVDIDAIRQRLARHASAIGPGGEKAWRAGQLAADVPALLAKVDELTAALAKRDHAAKALDSIRDYILGAIEGDGLDAAEMHDIAGDLASVLGYLGHPVANEDGCDCESYDCKGQCCGVGNCTCTPARPIVTVELPAEATR